MPPAKSLKYAFTLPHFTPRTNPNPNLTQNHTLTQHQSISYTRLGFKKKR